MMPLVTASESGTEQTESFFERKKRCGVSALLGKQFQTSLEREAVESDSLVEKVCMEIAHKE